MRLTCLGQGGVEGSAFGAERPPPPGGEAPSNVDLVMSVRELIHPKPPKMLTR